MTDLDLLEAGAQILLPENGLAEVLKLAKTEKRPLRVKFGIDPTGSDLTLGHAVVLRKLRQFQDLGHTAVLIIGAFTGSVGDPTGRTSSRPNMSVEETTLNAQTYLAQALLILDPNRLEVRWNTEWLANLTLTDIIQWCQHVTVAQMVDRDDFSKRLETKQPIALSEFLYPILQGLDSVEVKADIELGGNDQFFNLMVGRDLQKAAGQRPQVVMTMPILEGLDGVKKMSKSANNFVALTEAPEEQFGKLMSIPDHMVMRFATLTTLMTPTELKALQESIDAGGPSIAKAKRTLASSVVSLFHGSEAAKDAERHFDTLFKNHEVPQDVPEVSLEEGDDLSLRHVLLNTGLAPSLSEAGRLIKQGGVRIDGNKVAADATMVPRKSLEGKVLQAGKRRSVRLI